MNLLEYQTMANIQKNHWWYAARRNIISKTISSLGFTKPIEILEVGSGVGANLEALVKHGTVYATDSHEIAVEYTQKLGLAKDVQKGCLPEDCAFDGKQFDLIVMFDVLEHIEDDLKTLQVLKKQIKSGGNLLITVPAFQFLWSSHDVFVHHKRRYTRANLKQLFEKAGYHVTYASYFNFFLFPIIWSIRQLKVMIKGIDINNPKSDSGPVNPVINFILKAIFGLESFLVPKIQFPFGVSLIAICEPIKINK